MVFIALAIVLAIVLLPQILVRLAILRHGKQRPELPGTGGELARHLLDERGLTGVTVEMTDVSDHCDPSAQVVRLLPDHHDGRSIAALAIAAHEVGHAIQHADGDRYLALRQQLARLATVTDRIAAAFFVAAPLLAIVARTPLAFAALLGVGVLLLGVRVLFTLATLPVELDASFRKALPILKEGHYLDDDDIPAAKSVLRAAAFTYLASALMTLVNLARWIHLLR